MNDSQLLESWHTNARSWTHVVREKLIPSRVAATDQAILQAAGRGDGAAILDLGCGEGWLSRALTERGWSVLGVDAVPALVDLAKEAGGEAEYVCAGYEDLDTAVADRRFDAIVANFSLLGEGSTREALYTARRLLLPGGRLMVQTLHPSTVTPYVDGWRTEDWSTFREQGWVPSPWYFRTTESWCALLLDAGFLLAGLREPSAVGALQPSSLLLLGQKPG